MVLKQEGTALHSHRELVGLTATKFSANNISFIACIYNDILRLKLPFSMFWNKHFCEENALQVWYI